MGGQVSTVDRFGLSAAGVCLARRGERRLLAAGTGVWRGAQRDTASSSFGREEPSVALHRGGHTDRSHSDIIARSRCNGTSPNRRCRILIDVVETMSNNGKVCSDDDIARGFG